MICVRGWHRAKSMPRKGDCHADDTYCRFPTGNCCSGAIVARKRKRAEQAGTCRKKSRTGAQGNWRGDSRAGELNARKEKPSGSRISEGWSFDMPDTSPYPTWNVGESIPKACAGHPYRDLAALAERLAVGLEDRARTCGSPAERKRLALLAAASLQVHSCLANTGVRSGLDHR